MREINYLNLRHNPPPPPDRAERGRWPPETYVRYPDYYESYYPSTYDTGYRRPYEDNYREQYQSQPYPYRPQYHDYPTRYYHEDKYESRPYPPREPPYPPRPRYEDDDRSPYRRESFSEYRDQPSKRRKARPGSSTHRYERSPSPETYRKGRSSHRVIREEYDSDSDNNDYGANSDAESIQSVREITDRTSQLSTDHQSDDEQAMTYKEWTDQEKKEYHDRLELVIALLGDEIQMPELIKTPTTSGARGPVVIKTKPEVLPPAPFVSKKFADHLERAESMVEKVDVIKKPKKEKPEGEDPQQTQVEQPSKVQVGLHLRPFNPTWLYKVTKEPWPKRVLPDTAIRQLTVNKEPPLEDYLISRAHVHKVQITSCLQMNAASHLDWYLIAMNKILTELQEECDDQEPRYKALQDLRHATAYANEYITDQAIFNHAGMTNLMREHYLKQMVGLENEEYNDLITQPYDSLAAFNGAVDTLLKEKAVRDRCAAFQKMARDNPTPAQSSTTQKNSDIVQKIYDKKYGKTSTKASKKPNYGPFDSKGKRKSNIKSDGQWSKSSNTSKSFPFPKPKQHRRKPKKGSYKPKSGGRGRDHN